MTDQATGLPYNLVETPAEYITVTSRLSPEFNQRQHPFCGLMLGQIEISQRSGRLSRAARSGLVRGHSAGFSACLRTPSRTRSI